ncbi:MAG: hypothetical protein AAGF85_18070 [Bacteroidota bacterium]
MKKLLSLLAAVGVVFALSSCGDDDDDDVTTFDDVEVTGPTGIGTLNNGQTGATAAFTVSVDANLTATYAVTTTGDVTVTSDETGTVSGTTVTVTFDAGTTAGAAAIILTVTDSEGDVASDEANFIINEPGDNAATIEGIPTSASIVTGQTLTVAGPITLTAADGFAATEAFVLQVNGGAAVDLGVTGTDTSPLELTDVALPTSGLAAGTYEILFTLTDSDGDQATFLHILNVEAISFFTSLEEQAPEGSGIFFLEISGSINADYELPTSSDGENIDYYVLAGRVKVTNSATLTIPAGSVLKGRTGTGANATALLVTRGAKLMAEGTSEQPIIFTAIADDLTMIDIDNGDLVGSLAPTVNGEWGGLIVLGNAPISASAAEVQIEGIPTSDADGLYGGDDATDNSGVITYVSVRHGGSNIGQGNEINGLSLGGVGSGTTINNIEIVANQDDGIEWFGGNVSIDRALVWNSGDDSMDTDQDWQGSCTNFLIVTPEGSAFELDGPEGPASRDGGFHTFDIGTVYAGDDIGNLVDWDGGSGTDATNAQLTNIYWYGIDAAYTGGIASFEGDGSGTSANWEATIPMGATLADIFNDGADAIVTEVNENQNTVGVQNDDMFKWTWPGSDGTLDALGL